ncbi:unnamed protein product, partial [Meganyctiphanes norvegica]
MEGINFFNKDYFLLELQKATAIKKLDENDSDSVQLEKVTNVTIGLVLAAKSIKIFDNHIILNWIRKGRKLTALIEEQFALYDTLSSYLQKNVNIEEDFQEWKQILNNTKYVFPANEKKGWALIFGDTPIFLEKVNPEELSKSYIMQQQMEKSDAEDEKIKQESDLAKIEMVEKTFESKASISKVHFSQNHFALLLQEVGAVNLNETEKDIPLHMEKVSNITIELVLAAKAINILTDEEILTWIRKGRKLTPLIEKQFFLYKQLSDYLIKDVEPNDIEKWKTLINSKYIFPSSDNEGWSLIFGELPELCQKIDKVQKSCKQLESPKTKLEIDTKEEIKSFIEPKLTSPKLEDSIFVESEKKLKILVERKNNKPEPSSNCLEVSPQFESKDPVKKSEKEGTHEYTTLSDNVMQVCETIKSDIEEDVAKCNETKLSDPNASDLCNDKMLQSKCDDSSDGEDDLDDLFNEVEAELNAAEENEEESKVIFSNVKIETHLSDTLIRSEKDIEIKNLEMTSETQIFSKEAENLKKKKVRVSEEGKCLSHDIADTNNDLSVHNLTKSDIDSDAEMQESREEGSDFDDFDDYVLELEIKELDMVSDTEMQESREESEFEDFDDYVLECETTDLFDFVEAELGAAEGETTDTKSNSVKFSEGDNEKESKKVHGGFTLKYFYSVLKEAGVINNDVDASLRYVPKLLNCHHITAGIVCALSAIDLFTNQKIFAWIKKCRSLSRNMDLRDHVHFAMYRELANYLMNESDLKEVEEWKNLLNSTECVLPYNYKKKQRPKWNICQSVFGYVPENINTLKMLKFNYNYFISQLLGFNAVKKKFKNKVMHYELVKPSILPVGLVIAVKAVNIFSDTDIISWLRKCKDLVSIDSEKIQEQLAVYKEFSSYLENGIDERDVEHIRSSILSVNYEVPMQKDSGWPLIFSNSNKNHIALHNRFKDFNCIYDELLCKEKHASLEVIDPMPQKPSEEEYKVWNDIFAEISDEVFDDHCKNKPFHSHYFHYLLVSKNVIDTNENRKLKKIDKVTVGLVMAAIHENFDNLQIVDWIGKNGTNLSMLTEQCNQFFMYKLLCEHLISLKCHVEAGRWKQLINSVEYQLPIENSDIWSNLFGNKIPNFLGMTLVGNFEFHTDNKDNIGFNKDLLRKCFQHDYDLQISNGSDTDQRQDSLFNEEYFASLLTGCGAVSGSEKTLKKVTDLTIGQVMAAMVDSTRKEEEIYEWIKQSEKNPCARKTLDTLNLKSQFFAYKLVASFLMNNPSDQIKDSWGNRLMSSRYVFAWLGHEYLAKNVCQQLHNLKLSGKWYISMKNTLTSCVDIDKHNMVSIKKTLPLLNIVNTKKNIKGITKKEKVIDKLYFSEMLIRQGILIKDNEGKCTLKLDRYKGLKVGHVIGVVALDTYTESEIKKWIVTAKGKEGFVGFGHLKRISHYLLCEVPCGLVELWKTSLNHKYMYTKERNNLSDIFRNEDYMMKMVDYKIKMEKYRDLCNYISKNKRDSDYIQNECKKFITGQCNTVCCKHLHICCKNENCISFPKSLSNKATKDGSETMMAARSTQDADKFENIIIFADKVYKPVLEHMELYSGNQQ